MFKGPRGLTEGKKVEPAPWGWGGAAGAKNIEQVDRPHRTPGAGRDPERQGEGRGAIKIGHKEKGRTWSGD